MTRLVFVAASCALLAVGCFSPDYQSGHLQCGPAGQCPPNFQCIQSHCYRNGEGPTSGQDLGADLSGNQMPGDMTPGFDLSPIVYPPAAVWVSSGGGSGA